jgi:formamidopyrimidine-DNA glycosylase
MPELPEVESIVCGLAPALLGRTIVAAEVRWERAVATSSPEAFVRGLVGRRMTGVTRRGKYILIALDGRHLLVHLRMTGRLLLWPSPQAEMLGDPYLRALLVLDTGAVLAFRDVRKFGRLWLVDDPCEVVGALGPEPLGEDFSLEGLHQLLRRRRQLKPLLLDQHALAGLGNIYVDEALWDAGLHPLRQADSLNDAEVSRLYAAIRTVLERAIAQGGTTLRDYRTANGEPGRHQECLAVYGRAGQPCPRCGGPVARIVVGQRGTHYCPVCQHPAPPL